MKKLIKLFWLFCFLSIIISLLVFPKESLLYAFSGLTLWFDKMIPVLLPFMIISTLMIRLDIHTSFIRIVSPFLKPIFHLNKDCLYTIFMGFLCGFPMGAKTCSQLYKRNKLSKNEAEYLLSFCNNIGPVYFLGFVLPLMRVPTKIPYLLGMYGIPFLYGILLRYTIYRKKLSCKTILLPTACDNSLQSPSILESIDDAVMSSLRQIAMLGGYMVLFNILNILPFLWQIKNPFLLGFIHSIFEITGGISRLSSCNTPTVLIRYFTFTTLSFGGLCCMAQTFSVLKDTDLSRMRYFLHKLILWFLCGIYYLFLFR